ncbi:hypothetical protein [Chitinophaga pinensis]|uniref:hypothetical protein n=1 Tax=Chitinophaga pinensis TaxID=79329 RepID=UPI0016442925|nr:hypothetical protein [Chitinophaga pinensis]
MNNASRRHFIKQSAAGLLGALYTTQGLPLPPLHNPNYRRFVRNWSVSGDNAYSVCR